MRPTLKDVAKATGLDVSTVSRALSGDTTRRVGERNKQRAIAAAEELGYAPHRAARALRTGRYHSIAFVLVGPTLREQLDPPFLRFRLYGAEEVLSARGYLLSLHRLPAGGPGTERAGVAGWDHADALLLNWHGPSAEGLALIRGAGCPVALTDDDIFAESGGKVTCVLSDREGGVRQAIAHLVKLGHRRIALVNAEGNIRRLAGYLRGLSEHAVPVDPRLMKTWVAEGSPLPTGRRGGYRLTKELLAEKVPFTAVQAGSDYTAAGVIDALQEAGLRVPEDVAVVGFDDVDSMGLSPFREPFLTTLREPGYEIGERAARLLLAQIEEGAEPQRLVLPMQLIVRASCGARRQGD